MPQITMEHLCIPFRTAFRHASASRTETQSLWVEAQAQDGNIGYGESCPREYVTGESLKTAKAFFERHQDSIASDITDLATLKYWSESHRTEIDRDPATWCAIELALLDLFAKQAKQTVEEHLGLPTLEGTFRYTAVLGDSDFPVFQQQLARYQAMGFSDYKIKISGDIERDQAKLNAVLRAGILPPAVRLDANNLWKGAKDATDHLRVLGGSFHAVEEPITAGDYDGMREVASELNVKIVLDESFFATEHFDKLGRLPGPWILNLRVSKMGGLLRSLTIIDRARDLATPVVIGAQVGETSLLTRAALTLASHARPILVGQEGAFGTLLVAADICDPSLMFGKEGKLAIDSWLTGAAGFGLSVQRPQPYLKRLA